jgi:putative sigma-54 modulation protein
MMNIYQISGRNIEVTDAMRQYAEDKLAKLERFSDHIVDAKVVMSYSPGKSTNPAKVEIQVNVPQGVVRAEERGADTYAAVDMVVDRLERQLKKHKERHLAKRHQESPPPIIEIEADDVQEPMIVRTKRHVLRPMSAEDAAYEMDALGHDFYMFRNAESDTINVIYLRDDGNYGLLEPA